jgi:hypothetical protein
MVSPPITIPNVPHPGTSPLRCHDHDPCVPVCGDTDVGLLWCACVLLPGALKYPEDKLRSVWFQRHPDAQKIKLKTVYVGEHRFVCCLWHQSIEHLSQSVKTGTPASLARVHIALSSNRRVWRVPTADTGSTQPPRSCTDRAS